MEKIVNMLKSTRLEVFIVLFLIILAAFLRLYKIADYMTFLGDEGRDVLVVKRLIEGVASILSGNFVGADGKLTLLGPTASVGGFYFGPVYYYMMVPFLWIFNFNPVGPAIMIALLGSLTVGMVYYFGKVFFNNKRYFFKSIHVVGFIAAFLYAISPIIIGYSRASWNPNPIPFFTLLACFVLLRAIEKEKKIWFILTGFLLGILMQLHFVTVLFVSVVFFFLLLEYGVHTKKKDLIRIVKNYTYIIIGFIIGWLPYIGFELRHNFQNTRNFITFILNPESDTEKTNFFITIFSTFFRLFARLMVNYPSIEKKVIFTPEIILLGLFIGLLAICSTGLFVYQFLQIHKGNDRDKKRKFSFIFLLIIFGIGLFGFYSKSIYDYYFGFMYFLPFVLVGNLLATLLTKNIILKVISICCFAMLVGINFVSNPFFYGANGQLSQTKEIASFIQQKAKNSRFNFALITGGNSDHAYRYFFELWGNSPVTIQNNVIDPQRKTVTGQLFVVCESLPCAPLGHSLWEIAGFGQATISGQWDVSVVKIYKLEPLKNTY